MLTLSIPQRKDPAARFILLALLGLVVYTFVAQPAPQAASAQADQQVIIVATPSLPTAEPTALPTVAPVVSLAAPTVVPAQALPPLPVPTEQPQQPDVVYVQSPPQIVYVEQPTAEPPPPAPVPTEQPAPAAPQQANRVIILATPGPGDPGFADTFKAPDPKAKCQFVTCLP